MKTTLLEDVKRLVNYSLALATASGERKDTEELEKRLLWAQNDLQYYLADDISFEDKESVFIEWMVEGLIKLVDMCLYCYGNDVLYSHDRLRKSFVNVFSSLKSSLDQATAIEAIETLGLSLITLDRAVKLAFQNKRANVIH